MGSSSVIFAEIGVKPLGNAKQQNADSMASASDKVAQGSYGTSTQDSEWMANTPP